MHIYFKHFIRGRQWVQKGFTGQITDTRGRVRYFIDGKPVARQKYEAAGHQHKEGKSQSESVKHVMASILKPNPGKADLQLLAEHLQNVPAAVLRRLRSRYGVQSGKSPVKEKLVSAFLDHVRGGGPAVNTQKYKEKFGVHPDKEMLGTAEGRAKLNDQMTRHARGEDVLAEVQGKKKGEEKQKAGNIRSLSKEELIRLSPDQATALFEDFQKEIMDYDPALSANSAGALAAMRVLNVVDQASKEFIDEIDARVKRGGDVSDEEDETYVKATTAKRDLFNHMVKISGYRPGSGAEADPLATMPIDAPRLKSKKTSDQERHDSVFGQLPADTTPAPAAASSPKPPEPGFTGIAGNGVRYINGVPQKSIEDALQGKKAKQDVVAPHIGHLDPKQVAFQRGMHDSELSRLKAKEDQVQAAYEKLKEDYGYASGSKKASIKRQLDKAKEEYEEASRQHSYYLTGDENYKNRLDSIAVDESQPEFIRLAATRSDEAFDVLKESAKQWAIDNGHDPRLGGLLAEQALQSPIRVATALDSVVKGETVRLGHMDARAEAKKHIDSLDLSPGMKKSALEKADRLYSEDLDQFKNEWTKKAEGEKAEEEKSRKAKEEYEAKRSAEQKAKDDADAYLKVLDAGSTPADVSPESMRNVVQTVLESGLNPHSNFEMPKGKSGKEQIDSILREGANSARFGPKIPKTMSEGWATDTKYMFKVPESLMAHVQSRIDAHGLRDGVNSTGRGLPIDDILPSSKGEPVSIIGGMNRDGKGLVIFEDESGNQVQVEGKYVANVEKVYPGVAWESNGRSSIVGRMDGEPVAMIMGYSETSNIDKASIGKKRELSDVVAPGPYSIHDIEDNGHYLMVGRGTPLQSRVEIQSSKAGYGVKAGGVGSTAYTTRTEAVNAAKEILAHAHGTDEDGNLIFKPLGSTTELSGDAKVKKDYYDALRAKAKAPAVRKTKQTIGGHERELHHVGEHFAIHQALPDAKGKVSGWTVRHTPSDMPSSTWQKKEDALQFAHILQNMPNMNWGQDLEKLKEQNPEEHSRMLKAHRNVNAAFENNGYHPDMGTADKLGR